MPEVELPRKPWPWLDTYLNVIALISSAVVIAVTIIRVERSARRAGITVATDLLLPAHAWFWHTHTPTGSCVYDAT